MRKKSGSLIVIASKCVIADIDLNHTASSASTSSPRPFHTSYATMTSRLQQATQDLIPVAALQRPLRPFPVSLGHSHEDAVIL